MAKKIRKRAVMKQKRPSKKKPAVVVVGGREEVLRKESLPVTEKDPMGRTDQLVIRKGPQVLRKE